MKLFILSSILIFLIPFIFTAKVEINNKEAIISKELENVLEIFPNTGNEFISENYSNIILDKYEIRKYKSDVNIKSYFKIEQYNNEIGIEDFKLSNLYLDEINILKEKSNFNISVVYKFPINVYLANSSINNIEKSDPNNNDYISIIYQYKPINVKYSYTLNIDYFEKILNYRKIIIALSKGKLYELSIYGMKKNQISEYTVDYSLNYSKNILKEENITNFFINKLNDVSFLTIFYKNKISIFEINYFNNSINLQLIRDLNLDFQGSKINDISFTSKEGYIIIIFNDKPGIYIYKLTGDFNKCISENDYFTSLVFTKELLYTSIKEKGIKIFDIPNFEEKKFIQLKHIDKIDFFINPFTGLEYLGVFFNNLYNEFFMEAEIIQESPYLKINKVFTLKNHHISSSLSYDNFFTYFLDKNENKIYSIRRGVDSKINSIIYEINVPTIYDDSYLIPIINNINNGTLLPGVYSSQRKTILVSDTFQYQNNSIFYNTNVPGYYYLFFEKITDSCASLYGNLTLFKDYFCKIGSGYRVNISGKLKKERLEFWMKMVLIFMFILIGFSIIWIMIATKCCKKTIRPKIDYDPNDINLYTSEDEHVRQMSEPNFPKSAKPDQQNVSNPYADMTKDSHKENNNDGLKYLGNN